MAGIDSIFSLAWQTRIVSECNSTEAIRSAMAGAGPVRFRLLDDGELTPVEFCIRWDADGTAVLADGCPDDEMPTFSASSLTWEEFFNGQFSAAKGVLSGKIRYRGPFIFPIRYGKAFDDIARVGSTAP